MSEGKGANSFPFHTQPFPPFIAMSISIPQSVQETSSIPYFVGTTAGHVFDFHWTNGYTSMYPITVNGRKYNVTMLGTFAIKKVSLHFRLYETLQKEDANAVLSNFSNKGFNVKILIDHKRGRTDVRMWK